MVHHPPQHFLPAVEHMFTSPAGLFHHGKVLSNSTTNKSGQWLCRSAVETLGLLFSAGDTCWIIGRILSLFSFPTQWGVSQNSYIYFYLCLLWSKLAVSKFLEAMHTEKKQRSLLLRSCSCAEFQAKSLRKFLHVLPLYSSAMASKL